MATTPSVEHHAEFRPSRAGTVARVVVAVLIAAAILALPLLLDDTWDRQIGVAAVFAVIGLSINVLTGHAGQISLGHQAFVGIGAFMSSFVAIKLGVLPFLPMPTANFFISLAAAGATGAIMALILGLIALRIRGLYLALITLAFGLMAENTIFNWRAFTGGGAGAQSPRPAVFQTEQGYAYLCMAFVALFVLIDWRLVKTKAGRAIVALRNDERVAATLGVNVTGYKLLAFVVSGVMAGVAGSLFAHRNAIVQALDFRLQIALVWVIMAVVGGLGSRAGVIIGSTFFALFSFLIGQLGFLSETGTITLPIFDEVLVDTLVPLLGAFLLLLTLTLYPGGIGQQLLPLRRWLSGGPFMEHRRRPKRRPSKAASATEAPSEMAPSPEVPGDGATAVGSPAGRAATPDASTEVAEPAEPAGDSGVRPPATEARNPRRGGGRR
jgi:branched-chain amino acid transport system permease protein